MEELNDDVKQEFAIKDAIAKGQVPPPPMAGRGRGNGGGGRGGGNAGS